MIPGLSLGLMYKDSRKLTLEAILQMLRLRFKEVTAMICLL